jgi:peptidyl-prolyl cis-trans isomerase A (cyclophilin A)
MRRRLLTVCLLALLSATAGADRFVKVVIQTTLGDIVVALNETKAPVTTKNFLRYVDAGKFSNGSFYRTVTTKPDNQPNKDVKIDVIQGGMAPGHSPFEAISLERTSQTGLRHENGTISMARDKPDSANAEFFICLGSQPELDFGGRRNPDGQGFAAFGRVVSGQEVVQSIHRSRIQGKTQKLEPPVLIQSIRRLTERT